MQWLINFILRQVKARATEEAYLHCRVSYRCLEERYNKIRDAWQSEETILRGRADAWEKRARDAEMRLLR